MSSKRPFYPYYREIRSAKGQVLPTVKTQQAWVRRRMESHPCSQVIEIGVEIENRYDGPNTHPTKRIRRPILEKINRAIRADEFHQSAAVVLLPKMPTHYQYEWIPKSFDARSLPIHPYVREGRERKSWNDGDPIAAGSITLLPNMSFKTLWRKIQTECSYFLSVVKLVNSRLLFRGIGDQDNGPAYIGATPNNKHYQITKIDGVSNIAYSKEEHLYVVDWMKGKGLAARPDNCIYCTPHPEHARTYSGIITGKWRKIYAIFPRNGFKFTWSQNDRELGFTILDGIDRSFDPVEWTFERQKSVTDIPPPIKVWDENQEEETFNFYDVSPEDVEIELAPTIFELDDQYRLEESLWFADYVSVDLARALRSDNEILISDTSYYALDWATYRTSILQELGFKLQNRRYLDEGD